MLGNVREYACLTSMVRGKKSFLLVKGDYDAMLAAESPTTALRRLEDTKYKPYVSQLVLEEFDLSRVEKALLQSYQDDVAFVVRNLKMGAAKAFLEEFGRFLELKALMGVLKSILMEIPWREASTYIFPYKKVDYELCRSLVENRNIKRTIELLKDRKLMVEVSEILEGPEDAAIKSVRVEASITKYGYGKLLDTVLALKGPDRTCIGLVGTQLDMINLMTVLRMKKLGFIPERIIESLIPAYYRLTVDELRNAASTASEKEAVRAFTGGHYGIIISPLLSVYEVKGDLLIFEIALKRMHASECLKAFYGIFHLGEMLAYLYLKFYEVKDLIAILAAKAMKIPADRVEPNLVLHQPIYPI
jgi:V/A-type H+-transporting ATPase subunit C